jgi:hypothetical protein
MCTVTFIPRRHGYRLGMNRDEQRTRPIALPPAREKLIRGVLCPTEPGGGTWIALNEKHVCLALVNWYSVPARVKRKSVSRGKIIQTAKAAEDVEAVQSALDKLPLKRMNPFRLIGIFPDGQNILEWRWDLKRLTQKKHPWEAQQWISSGFDERTAQRIRSETFRRALRQRSAGSAEWLRRLHRSHSPEPGPFSTCMHRAAAATVSYTEVSVSSRQAAMRYHAGAPCGVTEFPRRGRSSANS